LHTAGQDAERYIKQARHQIAFSIGTKQGNIVFTSGGTEANNLAVFSAFYAGEEARAQAGARPASSRLIGAPGQASVKGGTLLVSAIEHPAVFEAANALSKRGIRVKRIPVFGPGTDYPGMVDVSAFRAMLTNDVVLVSVLHVSNEIGTIQPIEEISRIISLYNSERGAQIKLHVDAVQSYGKLAIDVEHGDFQRVDTASFSAHKIHGPKGVGALFAAAPGKLHPMIFGGGQEGGVRSGTENVPGIVGLGACSRVAIADIVGHAKEVNICRRRLLEGIISEIPQVHVNSPSDASVTGKAGCSSPYILSVGFPGTRGEVLLHELEKSGIFVSTGAACSALGKEGRDGRYGRDGKSDKKYNVLSAIGIPDEAAEGTLRFGLSWMNEPDEIDFVVDRLKKAVGRFRRVGV